MTETNKVSSIPIENVFPTPKDENVLVSDLSEKSSKSVSPGTSSEDTQLFNNSGKEENNTKKINSDENATDAESTDSNDYQRELDSGFRIITEIVRQNK